MATTAASFLSGQKADNPYGVEIPDGKIKVRCLNGGAWDRATHLGITDDYESACALAEQAQADGTCNGCGRR